MDFIDLEYQLLKIEYWFKVTLPDFIERWFG